MAVSAVWRLVYFLASCPSEPKEQTAAHRRDALCPSTKIQKQAAFGIMNRIRICGLNFEQAWKILNTMIETKVTHALEHDGRFYLVENVLGSISPETGEQLGGGFWP